MKIIEMIGEAARRKHDVVNEVDKNLDSFIKVVALIVPLIC